MIKVLVADDHAVVRRGLMQILDEAPGMKAAGEASTGRQVLRAVLEDQYDVLVLDMAMPEGGGLEVLQELRHLKPDLPVLILSMYSENQYAIRALKAGAAGYLTKESAPDELVTAIRQVGQGEQYVSRELARSIADLVKGKHEPEPHESLSDREYQVMCALAQGKTVSQIAADMALSPKTISTYRTRVLRKLQLETTPEIVRYAIKQGLVE